MKCSMDKPCRIMGFTEFVFDFPIKVKPASEQSLDFGMMKVDRSCLSVIKISHEFAEPCWPQFGCFCLTNISLRTSSRTFTSWWQPCLFELDRFNESCLSLLDPLSVKIRNKVNLLQKLPSPFELLKFGFKLSDRSFTSLFVILQTFDGLSQSLIESLG